MLLPTVFFGLLVLVLGLVPVVLGLALTSLEGVALLSLGLLVLTSAALLAVLGFLEADSALAVGADLGVSGLAGLDVAGRVRGEEVVFLGAGVDDSLLTSFLTGVVVLGVGVRPEGGAVVLAGEGLAVVDGVLGVAVVGLDVDVGVLEAVVGVAGLGAAGEERAAGTEPTDLAVLATDGLGASVVLLLVVDAVAGLGAGAVVFGLGFRPLAGAAGAFLIGCAVPVVFTPLDGALAGLAVPSGFFSATLVGVLAVGAVAEPTGFLGPAVVEVFLSRLPVVVFLVTPFACDFCAPFVRRLWPVGGRELVVDALVPAMGVFVLAGAFVLAFGSVGFSFPVLLVAESGAVGCGSASVAGKAWS